MPVKLQALHIQCRQCGWTVLYAPASDALVETPPSTCKQCGGQNLSRTSAGVFESALSSMLSLLKK